jgi:hypothetical protein
MKMQLVTATLLMETEAKIPGPAARPFAKGAIGGFLGVALITHFILMRRFVPMGTELLCGLCARSFLCNCGSAALFIKTGSPSERKVRQAADSK